MRRFVWGTILSMCAPVWAAYIVPSAAKGRVYRCEKRDLYSDLIIYRDPTFFVGIMSLLYKDPEQAWTQARQENPIVTTLSGTVHIQQLSEPEPFKRFGMIEQIYERADSRFHFRSRKASAEDNQIIQVALCGPNDGYLDQLGFVFQSDFEDALKHRVAKGSLPSSVLSIPELPPELRARHE